MVAAADLLSFRRPSSPPATLSIPHARFSSAFAQVIASTFPPSHHAACRTYFNVVSLARLLLPGRRGATDGSGIGERWARPPPPTATARPSLRPSLFLRRRSRSTIPGYCCRPRPHLSRSPRDGRGIRKRWPFSNLRSAWQHGNLGALLRKAAWQLI